MWKAAIFIIVMAVMVLPLAGCMTDDIVTPAQFTPIATIANRLAGKEGVWDSYGTRITALEGRPSGGGTTFDPSALNNKDVDLQNQINTIKTDYQAKIDALSAQVNKLTPGTGGGTPTSDTGTVNFVNNPAAIPQIFSSSTGGNSNPWIMTIKNNSSTWQYVKPVVQLNVASGQPSSVITDAILMISGGSCSMTGQVSVAGGNISFSPSPTGVPLSIASTPSLVMMPISGCNGSGEIQIGPGQSQAVNIQIQGLKTPNAILWNVTASISSRSM